MSERRSFASDAIRSHGLLLRCLLAPVGLLYRLWTRTLRFTCASSEDEAVLRDVSSPTVILLWHNRLFVAGEYRRRFRPGRLCHGLVSGSRDGAWLESFYRWAGIPAVRGSQNKRGAGALRDLARILRDGGDVGITPDGSRGPCYELKPGALLLAKIAKAPILLLAMDFSSARRLRSWDKFFLPLPFSKVRLQGRKIDVGTLLAHHSPEEAAARLQEQLLELTQQK